MNCRIFVLFFVAFLTSPLVASDQERATPLPVDSAVTVGALPNGLRYYIRRNGKPERRAELRLVVNAGSILEDEDQKGLAHFCEHMAFNGTLHFRKNELVNYLESIGMRFGADVNAYTSFDETVYMLEVPTDSQEIVHQAFQILEDWAHLLSFDDDEIDRERGVVIEEWRLRRGAAARMRDKQFPVLFSGSRYADRLPIGEKKTLESFRHETLRQFYRSWYRPDLMAVVAVGDFTPAAIEALIREHFSGLQGPAAEKRRETAPVPDHDAPLTSIVTDSEATLSVANVYWKHPVAEEGSLEQYRRSLVENLYNAMLNNRLAELTKKPDPPFLFASSSDGSLVRSKAAYMLSVGTKNGGVLAGLKAALREAFRVRTYGFTSAELAREKSEMLRSMEQAYDEREKSESSGFADEYIRNFLEREPIPGIAVENDLYHSLLPGIALEEINAMGRAWMNDKNRVILVQGPARVDAGLPDEAELAAAFREVEGEKLEAYADKVGEGPLVGALPPPGTIVSERTIDAIGVTELRLSNGFRLFVKPTNFKNDEVMFGMFGPGGTSLSADSDYVPAMTAASVVQQGGVGSFDQISLQKKLAGKIVTVTPYIGELEEGIGGGANPRDLETMFQLIYLFATAPRVDSSAYLAFRARIEAYLQNRSARPESAFEDTLQVTMAQYHPRRRPLSLSTLERLDLGKSFAFYRDRFSDAGAMTMIIVGNIPVDTVRRYAAQYLAVLPSTRRDERWRDVGVRTPQGVIEKQVARGIEPKSQVRIIFSGAFDWSQENRYLLNSLADVLEIKMREQLREEKGGTYGVSVGGSAERDPVPVYRLSVDFGCAPERLEELVATAFGVIDSVCRFGVDDATVAKGKETQRREHETRLTQNQFWLSNLEFYISKDDDPLKILAYPSLVAGLTPTKVRDAALRYCDRKNYVKVSLVPR